MSRALVIQGGGFRTAFTSGVLDALHVGRIVDFDIYAGVSGGAIAMSYFITGQYRKCFEAISILASDPHFVRISRAISETGYMDIDHLERIARDEVPLNLDLAIQNSTHKDVRIVATERETGHAAYLQPSREDWIDATIASSTLPFVTKGRHFIRGIEYFDGGWSDPIPVRWAYEQGARHIVVVRTTPSGVRINQSWPDYLGSWYFRTNKALSDCFNSTHIKYNDALDFIETPPEGTTLHELAPIEPLKSGSYSYTSDSIIQDYRQGLDIGLEFVEQKTHLRAKNI
ncbi:MAG: patatin family protein [Flavobacteriales bacterium]|nr:patatin family protein [Flavobacteriales bacterium]NNK79981.1 patatin family protein [Flavobacteriales bacterium]